MRAAATSMPPTSAIADVPVGTAPMVRLRPFLPAEGVEDLHRCAARTCELLPDRTVWSVNSAASGGGVAELLRTLLPYWRGCGIDARWAVVRGTPPFFRVTKRLHNWLHGGRGDGGDLGAAELALVDRVSAWHADALARQVAPGDIVLLQDPQTAPLVAPLKELGAMVIWRCHVGADCPNVRVHRAWEVLLPRLQGADAVVFTRPSFVPAELDGFEAHCIAPAIDPAATKNRALPPRLVAELAGGMGVVRENPRPSTWMGSAEVISEGRPPRLGVEPIVLSLCRWDRLKDPTGIIDAFGETVAARTSAHLLLAGPAVGGVEDDPESADVFRSVLARWSGLSSEQRRRVHVVCLPLADVERNAVMVNVLQHIADVVVKKSRAEGFGLGVTEAMWKRRPVVATAVGGQNDQVEHGRTGLLVDDPDDLASFGRAVVDLLRHPAFAARLGHAGRDSVRSRFLPDHHFVAWSRVFESVLGQA
jgi:trehalose synthase